MSVISIKNDSSSFRDDFGWGLGRSKSAWWGCTCPWSASASGLQIEVLQSQTWPSFAKKKQNITTFSSHCLTFTLRPWNILFWKVLRCRLLLRSCWTQPRGPGSETTPWWRVDTRQCLKGDGDSCRKKIQKLSLTVSSMCSGVLEHTWSAAEKRNKVFFLVNNPYSLVLCRCSITHGIFLSRVKVIS